LREERLNLMKRKVREEMGRELEIKYDTKFDIETDEELLALEAEQVKDQEDLPGDDLKVSYNRNFILINSRQLFFKKYL
jgi:hypothetical protein